MHPFKLTMALSLLFVALPSRSLASVIQYIDGFGGESIAVAVNNKGQVTGSGLLAGNAISHAFLYDKGVLNDLGTAGGSGSSGNSINRYGVVAGTSAIAGDASYRAFFCNFTASGELHRTMLGTLGGTRSSAWGINDHGELAGTSTRTGDLVYRAFKYVATGESGSMYDLGSLGGASYGRGINNSGFVVGDSGIGGGSWNAFVYKGVPGAGGRMWNLGTLGGADSAAYAINDLNQIVGQSTTTGGAANHAFLYEGAPGAGGRMFDLGTLKGGFGSSSAWDINSQGAVVGQSDVYGYESEAAFLYLGSPELGGKMIDLDLWLDHNHPLEGQKWSLDAAYAINDFGWIAGEGYYYDGPGKLPDGKRAFLLDAGALIPEPSVAIAAFVLQAVGRCKRMGRKNPKQF